MSHKTAPEGNCVLMLAPFGRDAESVVGLLQGEGYVARAFSTLETIARAFDDHVGVILLTEEALGGDAAPLVEILNVSPLGPTCPSFCWPEDATVRRVRPTPHAGGCPPSSRALSYWNGR